MPAMNPARAIRTLSILSILLSLVGCSREVDSAAVLGTYVANHNKGLDEIELRQDGTYVYVCRLDDGKTLRNTDGWTLHYENGQPRITFNHFTFCLSEYGAQPAYWDVPVDRTWTGTMRLPLDPDLGYYFIKQNSAQ
jgi:hypothetical protein